MVICFTVLLEKSGSRLTTIMILTTIQRAICFQGSVKYETSMWSMWCQMFMDRFLSAIAIVYDRQNWLSTILQQHLAQYPKKNQKYQANFLEKYKIIIWAVWVLLLFFRCFTIVRTDVEWLFNSWAIFRALILIGYSERIKLNKSPLQLCKKDFYLITVENVHSSIVENAAWLLKARNFAPKIFRRNFCLRNILKKRLISQLFL